MTRMQLANLLGWPFLGILIVLFVITGYEVRNEKRHWHDIVKVEALYNHCVDTCNQLQFMMEIDMIRGADGIPNDMDDYKIEAYLYQRYDDSARYYLQLESKFNE